jgi:hypothetical protein
MPLIIKDFWLHIRSQLHVTTEPLMLHTKTTSQYKKHRVMYLIFCYWDKPMKFHRCQTLTTFSVASLSVVILAIFTLCFYRPWKPVILFIYLCYSETFEQSVWWLDFGVGSRGVVFWFPAGATYFSVLHDMQTDCGFHPLSIHRVSLGSVSDKAAGAVKLITHRV